RFAPRPQGAQARSLRSGRAFAGQGRPARAGSCRLLMPINLTTALAVLAVLVLEGIGVQGMWRARRIGEQRGPAAPLAAKEPDARREPSMGGPAMPAE